MKIMILCLVVLLVLVAYLIFRLQVQKSQIRAFTRQINEIREHGHNKLVTVDTFAPDYVDLANELNKYVEMEQELLKRVEDDRQSVKMMVAGISHDFRTPLTAATGYMQMVRMSGELSEKNEEYLDIAIEKTKYLKELSDEFFTLSLVESGRKEEDIKLVSVKKILEDVTLSQYEWISERELEFKSEITDSVCEMKASEVDLMRLFENLYSNASKYTLKSLKVVLTKEDGRIRFSISNDIDDLGCLTDMDADDLLKPFYRASSSGKPGSGLGLYISKLIVESYGGEIHAKIEDGEFEIDIDFA
jgi:signal transduction histidine kinase